MDIFILRKYIDMRTVKNIRSYKCTGKLVHRNVAQMVEHSAYIRAVAGSIPAVPIEKQALLFVS